MRAARTRRASRSSSARPPPNWSRRPSPRAKAPRATFWKRQRGEYFIVRTDRITPARIPALTEVEAKVVEAWQAEERRKLADAKVKAALEKANAGTDLADDRQGSRPRGADGQGGHPLRGRCRQLPQPAGGPGALQARAGQDRSRCAPREGSVIVRLKQVEAPDLAKDKEALDRFGKQLDTMMANDLILELVAALRAKYGVTVDEAAFAAAFRPQQPVAAPCRSRPTSTPSRRATTPASRRSSRPRWSPTSRRRSRPISSWPTAAPIPSCWNWSRAVRCAAATRSSASSPMSSGAAPRARPRSTAAPAPTPRPSSRSTAGRWKRCAC